MQTFFLGVSDVVYMFTDSELKTARDDLWPMIEELFSLNFEESAGSAGPVAKPRLLWALLYNQLEFSKPNFQLENLLVTENSDGSLDYGDVVDEVRQNSPPPREG